MKYLALAEVYDKLESKSGKLEKTHIIAKILTEASKELLPRTVLLLNGMVFPSWCEEELGVANQLMIKSIAKSYGINADAVVKAFKKTGDLGKSVEELATKKKQVTLGKKELTIDKVFDNIQLMARQSSGGSQDRKMNLITELLIQAGPVEAKYIVRTILGELRVGVAEGIVRDAIAEAFGMSPEVVENAWFLYPDYGEIARIPRKAGRRALGKSGSNWASPLWSSWRRSRRPLRRR
jgi:DNA ligase 1